LRRYHLTDISKTSMFQLPPNSRQGNFAKQQVRGMILSSIVLISIPYTNHQSLLSRPSLEHRRRFLSPTTSPALFLTVCTQSRPLPKCQCHHDDRNCITSLVVFNSERTLFLQETTTFYELNFLAIIPSTRIETSDPSALIIYRFDFHFQVLC